MTIPLKSTIYNQNSVREEFVIVPRNYVEELEMNQLIVSDVREDFQNRCPSMLQVQNTSPFHAFFIEREDGGLLQWWPVVAMQSCSPHASADGMGMSQGNSIRLNKGDTIYINTENHRLKAKCEPSQRWRTLFGSMGEKKTAGCNHKKVGKWTRDWII